MKQIRYDLLLQLLRRPAHIRALAQELATNSMTVKRALDRLVEENVLDVKREGRNRIFSIKPTIEARATLIQAEQQKLKQFIHAHPELRTLIEQLQTMPTTIVLFGSYADNTARTTSDIDIYAETQQQSLRKKIELLDHRIQAFTKLSPNSPMMQEIARNHVVIKGVEAFHENIPLFAGTQEQGRTPAQRNKTRARRLLHQESARND